MKTSVLDARTVAVVRELRVEKRQGANGEFESKDILFRIAVDRDYKVSRTENGKTITEYPTDFWLAKATGNIAQALSDYCTAKKEDGKLVSRHLLLSGSFETYQKNRPVKETVQANINGQLYNIAVELQVPDTNTIFMIDEFKFLDRNPENTNATTTTVATASVTPVATPVAQPVATAPVAQPVQPVAVAPMAQPVAMVAQPVATAPVAQPVADMGAVMNPPTVDPNFVPAGQTAPF